MSRAPDALLAEVIGEAKALGIPVSRLICPQVKINTRAKQRFGCCTGNAFGYTIELSFVLLEASELAVKETLAHEILHTCRGCRNHGERWKQYAKEMNDAYGYSITRVKSGDAYGVRLPAVKTRYLMKCQKCGAQYPRSRRSQLVLHPERYHCRCGGSIVEVDIE